MEKNKTKVTGIFENETFVQKCKRKAMTAVNWGKTHWKGIAIGAVALGGGAYMLSRRGNDDGHGPVQSGRALEDGETVREAIERAFDSGAGDGSDVGPDDDEPEVDEY